MSIESIPDAVDQPYPTLPLDSVPEEQFPSWGDIPEDMNAPPVVTGEPVINEPPPKPKKRVNMSKAMKKSMDKFMKRIAELPLIWFDAQAQLQPEWRLTEDERDLMTESVKTVFELLDIGFEVEAIDLTLKSVWWVVSYPFVVFAFIFFTKKGTIQNDQQEQP